MSDPFAKLTEVGRAMRYGGEVAFTLPEIAGLLLLFGTAALAWVVYRMWVR